MAIELGTGYVSLVPSAKGFSANLASELGSSLEDAGKTAGDKASAGFGSSFASKIGDIGKVAAAGLAAGIASAAGLGVGLFKLGATFDDAFDKIRTTTGATGDQLAGLEGSFKTVFSSVPTNADDASSAVATLNQKLGLTGAPLEGLSEQLLQLSHVTGTDLQGNVAATVDVFNSFGVAAADQPAKLDELFRASQATGVSVADLASTMANAGPNLQQLGFSFEQSAGLLAIFGKAGVDAAAVLPALSVTIKNAAKDGKSAGDVFRDTFDAIKNAPDDTAAAGAAIDTFGAKAGPKLAGLIRQGKLGYDELAQSISSGGDTISAAAADTADFSEKFNVFKNKILVGLEPLATGVFNAIGDAMVKIGPLVGPVITEITGGFTAFFNAFKAGDGDVTSSGFPGFMEKVANGARQVFDAVSQIDFKAVFAQAVDFISPIVDALQNLGGSAFELLKSTLTTVIQLFRDNQATIEGVLSVVKGGLTTAINDLATVFGFLADHMGLVKAVVIPLVAAFVTYQTIVGTITLATKVWTAIQAAFNVVMALNPIGLVVAAIAALVVGVIYAYTHFDTFRAIVDGFWQVIQTVFHWIVDNWPLLLAILTGPIGVAVLLITKNWDTIKDGFTAVKDWIFNRISDIVSFFAALPGQIWGFISGLYEDIKNGITAVKDWIFGRIEDIVGFYLSIPGRVWGVISGLYEDFKAGMTAVKDWISQKVDDIVSFFAGLPGRVASAVSGLAAQLLQVGSDMGSSLLSGLASALSTGFDFTSSIVGDITGALRGAINSVIDALNVAIPNKLGVGPLSIDIPDNPIPRLAKGGIVTRETLAVIGESGPEAVIPLSHLTDSLVGVGAANDGRPISINQTFYQAMTPRQVADELSWTLRTGAR